MAEVKVAATQFAAAQAREDNVVTAERLVRDASAKGANIVLLQELFETHYFCKDQEQSLFSLAMPAKGHPTLTRMAALARELGVVLPVSFFERANNAYYNSIMVIDADRVYQDFGALKERFQAARWPTRPTRLPVRTASAM